VFCTSNILLLAVLPLSVVGPPVEVPTLESFTQQVIVPAPSERIRTSKAWLSVGVKLVAVVVALDPLLIAAMIGTENSEPIQKFPRIGVEITEVESNGLSPFDGQGRWIGFPDGSVGTSGSDLFGIETFIAPGGGIWRKTYISNTQPDLSMDGYIEEPDGDYPVITGRDFRRMPTSFRSVGSKWEVVKQWQMSGENGWAPEFYTPPPP